MKSVKVKIMRLPHGAGLPLPAYQSADAAGLDLMAAVPADAPVTIAPGGRAQIPTGIAIALPRGTEGQVRPRSGLAARHGITVLNTPGTVDSDYRGEIQVILVNFGSESFSVERGQRIAQLVIAPVFHAQLLEAKNWPKPRAEPKALDRRAKDRLTKSPKSGRNIVPLYAYNGRRSPNGAALPQGSPRDRCRHRCCAAWPGQARFGQGPGRTARSAGPTSRAGAAGAGAGRHPQGYQGPRGGYELARERRRITADDILRAAGTIEDASDRAATAGSTLLNEVVIPAVGQAERAFSIALTRINLDDLVRKAEALRGRHGLIASQPATPRRHRPRSRSGLFRLNSACA